MTAYVLVVDDDPDIRRMVTAILEFEHYRVVSASNGKEALELIAADPPEVMLLDLRMPVLDGWAVTRTLREEGRWVPTIIMTAAADASRCCAEVNADVCLPKPFGMDEILDAVAQVRRASNSPAADSGAR